MSVKVLALSAFFGATGTTVVAAPVVGGQWKSSIDARVEEIKEQADKTHLENERFKSENEDLKKETDKILQAKRKFVKEKQESQKQYEELHSTFDIKVGKEVEEKLKNLNSISKENRKALFQQLRARIWDTYTEPSANRQKGWTCRNTVWVDDKNETKGIAYCIKEGEK